MRQFIDFLHILEKLGGSCSYICIYIDFFAFFKVLTNLLVSHIEVRGEGSLDIQQYTHSRKVEKVVVKLDTKILGLKEKYLNVSCIYI